MNVAKDKIYRFNDKESSDVDLYITSINAGFPSPAEDHVDVSLNLNDYLVKHPSSTFYIYVKGDSMIGSGIYDGDLMVVDRSLDPKSNNVVVAVIDGEFTVKKIYVWCVKSFLVTFMLSKNNLKQSNDVLLSEIKLI